jgi:hypothetical protein
MVEQEARMMANKDKSCGTQVHMIRLLDMGGAYTVCGHIYGQKRQYTENWALVTCKNCLRHKPTNDKEIKGERTT